MNDEKLTPRLGEFPMTIVAIMKESEDSLLLAADSQFTDGAIRSTHSKLRTVPEQLITWSSAGNPSIGLDEFGGWLKAYDFSGKNWSSFAEDATSQLSRLNGAQRERTRLSGVEWNKNFAADVIIAGWLAGIMGAYALSEDGRFHDALQYGFEAIGVGAAYAKIALSTVRLCQGDQDKEATLKIVMRIVAERVQDCILPIEAFRLKKDIIEPVFQFGNNLEEHQPINKSEKEQT